MKNFTVKIEEISAGKNSKGYVATIKELGGSKVMADSMEEICELLPDFIKFCLKEKVAQTKFISKKDLVKI